ncbi:hypothetical protein RZO50_09605 [Microbacterium sp. SSW1-59]|uniref:hypothetical protein n=1 Tax=Microbacterium xanthum TaxID=3079794 RepID=UPI002AD42D30|nr:hypothetical protein [Microbacterium sp. SSW1-59]MDZ8201774.1 hypothetical protein [Microbacterium sp. SSW1-59]
MQRHSPLPVALPAAFSVASADDLGVSAGRLRGRDLGRPFHGVRTRSASTPLSEIRDLCRAYAPRVAEHQFFSHETALALYGFALPGWPYRPRVHVSTHRPRREPRTVGVIGHRLQARETAVRRTPDGLPVEDPARAWRQCGTLWSLDDLIAAADTLSFDPARGASRRALWEEVDIMGDVRGGLLGRALEEARDGVRSPRETRLRLLLVREGLPEPEINWTLRDEGGSFVAELDLAFPRWKVAPEYDGRVHAEDAAQFARDADRWEAIRRAGWRHVRCLDHHVRGRGIPALRMVVAALVDAGWRPPRTMSHNLLP